MRDLARLFKLAGPTRRSAAASEPAKEVRVGELYERTRKGGFVETARVLGVWHDAGGVPHVRYHLSIAKSQQECIDDRRILCLDSFNRIYPDRPRA